MTAEKKVPRRYTREVKLYTSGKFPELDNLKICYDLLAELPANTRLANLNFIADKLGYKLYDKLRGHFV